MPKKEIIKKKILVRSPKIIKKTTIPIKSPRIVKKTVNIDKALVENFIALQKVMTNLSIKFDDLTTQISKLLELFEISAKTIAEKNPGLKDNKSNEGVTGKLDNILEQNKVIARGLSLLHESGSPPTQQTPRPQPPRIPPQLPPRNISLQQQTQEQRPNINKPGEYQKSISSKPKDGTEKITK